MKRIYFLMISLFMMCGSLFSISCSNGDDNGVNGIGSDSDNFSISLASNMVYSATTSVDLQINTSRQWVITIYDKDKGWVDFSSYQGVASSTVKVKLAINPNKDWRYVDIFVSNGLQSKTVRLIQQADGAENIGDLGWVELPQEKSMSNTLFVTHNLPDKPSVRNYSLLYDTKEKLAYWVAYPMHSSYLGGVGRTDAWDYDPKILTDQQAVLFSGVSGYDRGHQIPSADRTSSTNNNKSTFYFSNMTPQNKTLNQYLWATLETKVRAWTTQCDTLYVVTGAMIKTSTDTQVKYVNDNSGKKIAVPKYYFKALLMRKGNSFTSIAYKMDNAAPQSNTDYNLYKLTVKELEDATGFVFFPKVPQEVKNTIDMDKWK